MDLPPPLSSLEQVKERDGEEGKMNEGRSRDSSLLSRAVPRRRMEPEKERERRGGEGTRTEEKETPKKKGKERKKFASASFPLTFFASSYFWRELNLLFSPSLLSLSLVSIRQWRLFPLPPLAAMRPPPPSPPPVSAEGGEEEGKSGEGERRKILGA